MPIVSSVLIEDARQADGRRWIGERHTDQVGLVYEFRYLGAAGTNAASVMAGRVASIDAGLVSDEISSNLAAILADGRNAVVTVVYATLAQIRAALREAYRNATRQDAIMLGDFLGSLTDAQLQTLFGMTLIQVQTLRVNCLTPAQSTAASIRAGQGQ